MKSKRYNPYDLKYLVVLSKSILSLMANKILTMMQLDLKYLSLENILIEFTMYYTTTATSSVTLG